MGQKGGKVGYQNGGAGRDGVTVSTGVAPDKFLAKIASDPGKAEKRKVE